MVFYESVRGKEEEEEEDGQEGFGQAPEVAAVRDLTCTGNKSAN